MAGTGEPRRALATSGADEVDGEPAVDAPRRRVAEAIALDERRGRRAVVNDTDDAPSLDGAGGEHDDVGPVLIGARAAAWPLDPELVDGERDHARAPRTNHRVEQEPDGGVRARRFAPEVGDETETETDGDIDADEESEFGADEPEVRPARAWRAIDSSSSESVRDVPTDASDAAVEREIEVARPESVEVSVESGVVEPDPVEPKSVASKSVAPTFAEPEVAEPKSAEPEVVDSKSAEPEAVEPKPVSSPVESVRPEPVSPEPPASAPEPPASAPFVPRAADPVLPTIWPPTTSDSAARTPVPVVRTPAPVVRTLAPVVRTPDPVVRTPDPVVSASPVFTPEPVVPATVTPAPVSTTPTPAPLPTASVARSEPAAPVSPTRWERPVAEPPAETTAPRPSSLLREEITRPDQGKPSDPGPPSRPVTTAAPPADLRSRPVRTRRPTPSPGAIAGLGVAPIRFRGLRKTYDSVVAVDGVDLDVPAGRVTALLGPNGAGKTTMLRLLLGLTRPTSGSAMFGRSRYAQLDRPQRRVGAVLEPRFHPSRTGRNHLRVLAATAGESDSRVDEMLALVGLSAVGRRAVGGYSAGMRQRLALAGALLGDPDYLILDEPTKGLDAIGLHWLSDLLESFADSGRAVLMSSCLMSEVTLVADEAVVLDAGRVRRSCSVAELEVAAAMVRVRVSEVEAARAVIRDLGLPYYDGKDKQGPYLRVRGEHTETIGAALFIAHVAVFELSREPAELTSDVLAAVAVA